MPARAMARRACLTLTHHAKSISQGHADTLTDESLFLMYLQVHEAAVSVVGPEASTAH